MPDWPPVLQNSISVLMDIMIRFSFLFLFKFVLPYSSSKNNYLSVLRGEVLPYSTVLKILSYPEQIKVGRYYSCSPPENHEELHREIKLGNQFPYLLHFPHKHNYSSLGNCIPESNSRFPGYSPQTTAQGKEPTNKSQDMQLSVPQKDSHLLSITGCAVLLCSETICFQIVCSMLFLFKNSKSTAAKWLQRANFWVNHSISL